MKRTHRNTMKEDAEKQKRDALEAAARMCDKRTVDSIHEWTDYFNQTSKVLINSIELVHELKNNGADIDTSFEEVNGDVKATAWYSVPEKCPEGTTSMALRVSIDLPVPDQGSGKVKELLKNLAGVCARTCIKAGPSKEHKKWSKKEEKVLEEYLDSDSLLSEEDMGHILGRTGDAVRTRLSILRMRRKKAAEKAAEPIIMMPEETCEDTGTA